MLILWVFGVKATVHSHTTIYPTRTHLIMLTIANLLDIEVDQISLSTDAISTIYMHWCGLGDNIFGDKLASSDNTTTICFSNNISQVS